MSTRKLPLNKAHINVTYFNVQAQKVQTCHQTTVELQMYFGLGLSLEGMEGPVHLNQALAFAIEAFGCSLVLLSMTRLGSRVTIACCMLQGQLLIRITTRCSH